MKSMLKICSVTMLRTVALFSAVILPIPVRTIGKSRGWTVVAVTGTGAGGPGVLLGLRAKFCQPK